MAHGLNAMLKRGTNSLSCKSDGKAGIGSRRIFAPQFKLQVLDSYRNDADCKGNQRATARKYGIHRRQIQKWLQVENNLRTSIIKGKSSELIASPEARKCGIELALRSGEHRQRDDVSSEAYSQQRQVETEAELDHGTLHRIGGLEARDASTDKRVPDIPQHSPTYSEHQWGNNNNGSDSEREIEYKHHCHDTLAYSPPLPLTSRHSTPPPRLVTSTFLPFIKCECPEPEAAPVPLPLDFTTHYRRVGSISPRGAAASPLSPLAVADNAAPMDLSLKKPYMPYPRIEPDLHTPVPICLIPPLPPLPSAALSDHPPTVDSHIWDLSTKAIKRTYDDISAGVSTSSGSGVSSSTCELKPFHEESNQVKPVKLFKPYLDDVDDSSSSKNDTKPAVITSNTENHVDVGCTSTTSTVSSDESYFHIHNNNNNNVEFKTEYSLYHDDSYHLDTRRTLNFYCPINADYYTSSNIHLSNHFDDAKNNYAFNRNINSIKQRQSYSLDFKLSAIECYYSDAICRGNQRAVASKYKIHRRQVQKWLKQEDQLRQRNDSSKQLHVVR